MQILADDQGSFCQFFVFYFTSCCNSNAWPQSEMPQYNGLKVQKFQSEDSFTQNDQILNSTMGYDFQDSKVLTSIMWRHSQTKFSDWFRNNCSIYTSHLCCHERAEWGRQNWLCPRVRKILGTPLPLGGPNQLGPVLQASYPEMNFGKCQKRTEIHFQGSILT